MPTEEDIIELIAGKTHKFSSLHRQLKLLKTAFSRVASRVGSVAQIWDSLAATYAVSLKHFEIEIRCIAPK